MHRKLRGLKDNFDSAAKTILTPDGMAAPPKECKPWASTEAPALAEKHLLERNQDRFGQAHGSFPTVPTFSEFADWAASTHQAGLALEGDYDDEAIEGAGRLLAQLGRCRGQRALVCHRPWL